MQIEYDNNFFDMLTFQAAHQFFSPALQALYLLVSGMPLYFDQDPDLATSPWFLAVFYYLLLWTLQIVVYNSLILFSRKNHGILTRHSVAVHPDALVEETKFNKSFFYWHGVVRAITRP